MDEISELLEQRRRREVRRAAIGFIVTGLLAAAAAACATLGIWTSDHRFTDQAWLLAFLALVGVTASTLILL